MSSIYKRYTRLTVPRIADGWITNIHEDDRQITIVFPRAGYPNYDVPTINVSDLRVIED